METQTKAGYAYVLVGLQYGDEGKARVVDHLAGAYDVIARVNDGANAGYTIVTASGELRLRQIPSGVLHRRAALYIGSGCVIGNCRESSGCSPHTGSIERANHRREVACVKEC